MKDAFLGISLAAHALWLQNDPRGSRFVTPVGASLDGASLDRASLVGASLAGASLDGASLDGARLVRARLDRARLDRASLVGARLDRASLVNARLVNARLDRASLAGASLVGASLAGASLAGANRIIGPQRTDGYLFTYCLTDKVVLAGCRRFTFDEYRKHTNEYASYTKRAETLAILTYLESIANLREERGNTP